jgi:hypothetical protein
LNFIFFPDFFANKKGAEIFCNLDTLFFFQCVFYTYENSAAELLRSPLAGIVARSLLRSPLAGIVARSVCWLCFPTFAPGFPRRLLSFERQLYVSSWPHLAHGWDPITGFPPVLFSFAVGLCPVAIYTLTRSAPVCNKKTKIFYFSIDLFILVYYNI